MQKNFLELTSGPQFSCFPAHWLSFFSGRYLVVFLSPWKTSVNIFLLSCQVSAPLICPSRCAELHSNPTSQQRVIPAFSTGAEMQPRPPTSCWCVSFFSSCRGAKHTAINLLIPRDQFSFFRPHNIMHSSSSQCQKLHISAPLLSGRSCCFMFYHRTICSYHHPASRFPTKGLGCAFSQWQGHDRAIRQKGPVWASFSHAPLPHLTRMLITTFTLHQKDKTRQSANVKESPFPEQQPQGVYWIRKLWEKQSSSFARFDPNF